MSHLQRMEFLNSNIENWVRPRIDLSTQIKMLFSFVMHSDLIRIKKTQGIFIVHIYTRCTLFPQFFQFYFTKPPKRCLMIFHSQQIFQICFTKSVESFITFPNLVQAVLNWAVGQS